MNLIDTENFTIRHATQDDLEDVKITYGLMLFWLDHQDFDILPTTQNVEWMTAHIFEPSMIDGRSEILIVHDEGGRIAAMLFWVIDDQYMDVRYLKATSYGQWVDPEFRGRGLVPKMIKHARADFIDKGIEQVLDMVHVEEARECAEACGFKIKNNFVTMEV